MKKIIVAFSLLLLMTACVSHDHYYKLDDQYLSRRQLQTRRFDSKDEEKILIASAQVLQDLGFTVNESETGLGLISASKDREAGSTAGKVAIVILAALGGTQAVYDTQQKIFVTLVSTQSKNGGYNVRAEFARVVWDNQGRARIEKIADEDVYVDFFDKLSQSVFLVANNI